MSFARLLRADAIAMIAALALLLVMALDWYGTKAGDEARRVQAISQPEGATGGEVERTVRDRAKFAAQAQEKNAWQLDGTIDVIILLGLLATVGLAVGAAYARAAARRFGPPLSPSTLAALVAALTGMLVAYRLLNEPGLDVATTVKAGPPLALILLGVISLACLSAMRREEEGTAWREPAPAVPQPAGDGGAA